MHPEIEKLIEMALADGQVTEKEREIILRKAEKIGIDVDEVDMYLEGKISSTNLNETYNLNNNSEKNNQIKLEINDSYIDKDDLKKVVDNISKFENRIIEIEQYYLDNFNHWINTEFLELIKNHPKKIELDQLKYLMNASSFFSGKKYREGQVADFLDLVIRNEGFIGYFALDYSLINFDNLTNSSFTDNYKRLLFTEKSVYFFDRNIYDIINKRFICSSIEFRTIKKPEIYNLKIYDCSAKNVINNFNYEGIENNDKKIMKNSGINYPDMRRELNFFEEGSINSLNFLHLFSLNDTDRISFDVIINDLRTEINYSKFKSVLKENNLTEIQISNLQKINNHVDKVLNDFNSFILKKYFIYYYSYLTNFDRYSFSLDEFYESLGHSVCTPRFNDELEDIINFYKYTITYIIVILELRDKLLNFYLTNNFVEANAIMLKIDNYGVFLTKFERTSIEKLEDINKSLNQLNNTLIEGFSMISDSIQSLNNSLDKIKNSIDKVESTMDVGNFIQIIQTYQMYKVNKNTKSLRS